MNADLAMEYTQHMLFTTVQVAAPVLGIALLVGLLISIFQVVTQIQEMTLTFVPKIAAVAALMLIAGPWMLNKLTEFATSLYLSIPNNF